jgi:hypothetical protein
MNARSTPPPTAPFTCLLVKLTPLGPSFTSDTIPSPSNLAPQYHSTEHTRRASNWVRTRVTVRAVCACACACKYE